MQLPAFVEVLLQDYLLLSIFAFALLYSFLMPISEEIALLVIGGVAAAADVPFWHAAFAAYPGLVLSDFGYYWLARNFGARLLDSRLLRRIIKREKVLVTEVYFAHKGHWIVFFCRFVVGLRAHAMIASGLLRLPFRIFASYDSLSATISCVVWLGLGYFSSVFFVEGLNIDGVGRVLVFLAPILALSGTAFVYHMVRRDYERVRDTLL